MNHKYLFKKVSKETLKKKIELGLCIRHGCRNKSRKNRNDCETCKSRMFRIKNPKRYAYQTIKSSAAKRKIPFDLSFDEFLEFDKETGYTDKVGKNSDSLTIDRIDSSLPYRVGNIRALTWIDNCSKKLEGITETWEPVANFCTSALTCCCVPFAITESTSRLTTAKLVIMRLLLRTCSFDVTFTFLVTRAMKPF